MARIRTLKPEWLEDEKLAALPDAARVLSVGLILLADDQGRGRANPSLLAGHVWPYHTSTKAGVELQRLADAQFVILYTVAGQQYYQIRNWDKHQRVDHPAAPRLPSPEQSNGNGVAAAIPEKIPKVSRGSRKCPDDFQLTEDRMQFAIGDGMDAARIEREFAKFKDFTFKTSRTDWDACWRNWIRTCTERQNTPPPRFNGPAAQPSRPQPDPYKRPDTPEEREWRKNYLARLGANVKDVP